MSSTDPLMGVDSDPRAQRSRLAAYWRSGSVCAKDRIEQERGEMVIGAPAGES